MPSRPRREDVIDQAATGGGARPRDHAAFERDGPMDENDPRRQLDPFTAALVEQLREELEITTKKLVGADRDVALAQLDVLRQGALHRLKHWTFEFETDLAHFGGSKLSEEDVLKLVRITIAAVEQTFDRVGEHVVECSEQLYGDRNDPDLPK